MNRLSLFDSDRPCHLLIFIPRPVSIPGDRMRTDKNAFSAPSIKLSELLILSMLGEIFSRRHIEIFSYLFPRKQDLKLQCTCKLSPTESTYMKYQILFSGKNMKTMISLSSAEFLQRVVNEIKFSLSLLLTEFYTSRKCPSFFHNVTVATHE